MEGVQRCWQQLDLFEAGESRAPEEERPSILGAWCGLKEELRPWVRPGDYGYTKEELNWTVNWGRKDPGVVYQGSVGQIVEVYQPTSARGWVHHVRVKFSEVTVTIPITAVFYTTERGKV